MLLLIEKYKDLLQKTKFGQEDRCSHIFVSLDYLTHVSGNYDTTHMNVTSAIMKVILLTGATDGIGLQTAKQLTSKGHKVLLHGRNPSKLQKVARELCVPAEQTFCRRLVRSLSSI